MKIRRGDARWSFHLVTYKDAHEYEVMVRLWGSAEHIAHGESPHVAMARALAWALERDGKVRFSRVYKPGTNHAYPEGSVFQDPVTGGPFTFTHVSTSGLWLVGKDAAGRKTSHSPKTLGVEVRHEWEPEPEDGE